MRFTLLAAVAAAAALAVASCGADSENGNSGSGSSATGEASGSGVDRAFVRAMIPHHQSAVEMAEIAQQRGESAFVKQLADDIVRSQNAEIATMRAQDRELAAAGVKSGSLGVPGHMMGMDEDPAMLNDVRPFDREFLKMMIPHHQGAVTMAKAELAKGQQPKVKQLAQTIIDAQQREISDMREQLGENAGREEPEAGHSG